MGCSSCSKSEHACSYGLAHARALPTAMYADLGEGLEGEI